ncbi:unnamed protein product [Caenorhabditis angaria]|uniref:ascorbate ferrireductase (transmembrane) n=1 Tax=Caenorhabditis angaria TaxID=860376 RepID=A0A9P1IFY4_9PELO|nr:unnamed protein product [Caenorhabditis angaria]
MSKFLVIFTILAIFPAISWAASLNFTTEHQNQAVAETSEAGLTKEQRRQFSKAHAILMILGWLFFVPTGFLFARLGRDLYKEQQLFGSAVWFQIHRVSNFLGVICIVTSILCIFISTQFHWKGTGSGSKYWTEWHTDLGVISTVLAVAQPLNSLLRCGPTHSKRVYFNWAHRITGILGYSLAFITIIIAAVNFKKIWNEPVLEIVLVSVPTVFAFALFAGFGVLESDRFRSKSEFGKKKRSSIKLEKFEPHILRAPAIFMSIGAFLAGALALSLLVANGYKNV